MKKKYIIASCVSALILILALLSFFIIIKGGKKDNEPSNNNIDSTEMITISFDSDGGEAVKDMKIKKGESVNLPVTTKKDYLFNGWYYNDSKVSNDTKFVNDTKLKAKWKKVEEGTETFTITFDSKGGSSVGKMTYECDKEINLPANPTKTGYNFVSWVDKNDTPILDKALLTCDDITLYANWEKATLTITFDSKGGTKVSTMTVECGKEISLPKPTKEEFTFAGWVDENGSAVTDGVPYACKDLKLYATWEAVKKQATCPDGYELKDGNKCVTMKAAESVCPDGYNTEKDGVCVNTASRNDGTRTCKKEYISGDYRTGTYIQTNGSPSYCGYMELSSYTGTKSGCENAGGTYSSINNHCYRQLMMNNYETTCQVGEVYYQAQALGGGSMPGCYKVDQKEITCKNYDGYTMNHTYGKCVKTIEPTYK